ncbi:MAG: hypothetical protein K2N51_15825 [Lachnospiraceae bacterium]|nr:hypothetical protein [Lachnospiraceae bacterium]
MGLNVTVHASEQLHAERIIRVQKMGNTWFIPKSAEKPADKRYKDKVGENIKQRKGAVK